MNKLILAISILATVAAVIPANAAPRNAETAANAKMFAISPGAAIRVGSYCWKQADGGRGYGFWTGCNTRYSFAAAVVELEKCVTMTKGRGCGTEGGDPGDDPGRGATDGDGGGGDGGSR